MSETQSQAVKEPPVLMSLPELGERVGGELAERVLEKPRKAHPAAFQKGKAPGPGRPKGLSNKLTVGLREAVEKATQPGACHEDGFAGWLVDRARGGIEDRKVFAAVVSRVIPLQVNQKSEGLVRIELGWLNGRDVGRNLAQLHQPSTQVIDVYTESPGEQLIKDQTDPDTRSAGQAAGRQDGQDGAGDEQGA